MFILIKVDHKGAGKARFAFPPNTIRGGLLPNGGFVTNRGVVIPGQFIGTPNTNFNNGFPNNGFYGNNGFPNNGFYGNNLSFLGEPTSPNIYQFLNSGGFSPLNNLYGQNFLGGPNNLGNLPYYKTGDPWFDIPIPNAGPYGTPPYVNPASTQLIPNGYNFQQTIFNPFKYLQRRNSSLNISA